MAKKKHKKKHGGPRPGGRRGGTVPLSGTVTLSQCMIVKNEERNIEQALSWGKGVVCEQIVVDTGSTDRTAEIAERMGARVLHFEWIDDFSAAKNYAIEQAKGDWIAFLDADEFFPAKDAAKLLPILGQIMATPGMRERCLGISCPMHQLNDQGKTMDVNMQARLFRNTARVRYTGRIHEELNIGADDIIRTEDITIMHTGYSESANIGTGKSLRNITLLRRELEQDPESLRMKMYLADSLVSHSNELLMKNDSAAGAEACISEAEAFLSEAEGLYKEVVFGDTSGLDPEYKKTAYRYLLRKYSSAPSVDSEYEEICEKARRENPADHKIMCLYAATLNNKGEHEKALEILRRCEARQTGSGRTLSLSVPDLMLMYKQFVNAAQAIGDTEEVIKYVTTILMIEKDNTGMLAAYIRLLMRQLPTADAVLEILSMLYDMKNGSDVEVIKAAAGQCGAEELAKRCEALLCS